MKPEETSEDLFLGGKLRVLQPKVGYRAATDPVLLAAAMNVAEGETVLDIGCGVGVASLCLGVHSPNAVLHGLEVQGEYADLAVQNAKANAQAFNVHIGDLMDMPPTIREFGFDHVMTNPPFFHETAHKPPSSVGKSKAHIADVGLTDWIDVSLRRVRPLGKFTMIHLAECLPEAVAAVSRKCGNIAILPIAPREGRQAKRFILQAKKGGKGAARLLAPLIMHAGASHQADGIDFTKEAVALLREGKKLPIL